MRVNFQISKSRGKYYVTGSNGYWEGPFKTLPEAQKALAELKRKGD